MAMNKTPISMLQELMVAMNAPLPTYSFSSVGNLLEPKFSCKVYAASFHVTAEARNKKDAKQLAAKSALMKLGYKVSYDVVTSTHHDTVSSTRPDTVSSTVHKSSTVSPSKNFVENRNYIGELNELASGSGCDYPEYEIPPFPENGHFKCICKFQNEQTVGYSQTKKTAKQIASYEMLLLFKSGKVKIVVCPHPKKSSVTPHHAESLKDLSGDDMKVLNKLKDLSLTDHRSSLPPQSESYPNIKKGHTVSIREAVSQLQKYKIKYEMKVLQRDPYIVVINMIEKRMTLLGGGITQIEATTEALNSTLEILQEGCSLIHL